MNNYEELRGLKAKRIEKGLSQQQLADMVGITQNALSCYERGISFPRRNMLDKLARALECEIKDIVGGGIVSDKLTDRIGQETNEEILKRFADFSKLFEAYSLIDDLGIKKTLSNALVEVGESLISFLRK